MIKCNRIYSYFSILCVCSPYFFFFEHVAKLQKPNSLHNNFKISHNYEIKVSLDKKICHN